MEWSNFQTTLEKVVVTVASGILLASFLSVECITNSSGFLLFLASTVNDVRTKLHIVEKHSTVEKRAKRMPDATV